MASNPWEGIPADAIGWIKLSRLIDCGISIHEADRSPFKQSGDQRFSPIDLVTNMACELYLSSYINRLYNITTDPSKTLLAKGAAGVV